MKPKVDKKAAAKATKPATKQAGNKFFMSPGMFLFLKDDKKETATQVKNYTAAKSTKLGVTPLVVASILGQIKGGLDEPSPEWRSSLPSDQEKKVTKAWAAIESDWQAHTTNRAAYDKAEAEAATAAKAKREADAAAAEADKTESKELMVVATKSAEKTLAKAMTVVDETIKGMLGDKMMISGKSGMIVAKKDAVLTKEDFAKVLAKFDSFDNYTESARSEASAREAQVAVLAKNKLGDSYKNLYIDRPRAWARVSKYTKVYETLKVLGKPIFNTVSGMRKAMEVKVSSVTDTPEAAAEKNNKAKATIIDKVIELQEKNERPATQQEITAIVNAVKLESGVKKIPKPQCIYAIPDEQGILFTVAGALNDPRLMSVMQFCITNKMTKGIIKDGIPVEVNVKGPNDKKNAWIDKMIADAGGTEEAEPEVVVNGKVDKPSKTKKGKAEPEPTPEPEVEEEEEEEVVAAEEGEEEEEENTGDAADDSGDDEDAEEEGDGGEEE